MPIITFTYTGKLPYHATHKLDDKWIDVCMGTGDTIELSESAQTDPVIKNLVKSGILVAPDAKRKNSKPKEENKITDNLK